MGACGSQYIDKGGQGRVGAQCFAKIITMLHFEVHRLLYSLEARSILGPFWG